MKTGIVLFKNSTNYGDDIQALAAYNILKKVDYIFDREKLNNPDTNEKVKLLCNGWFMKNPMNWPPAENLQPLFISMHISHNNNATKYMTDKKWASYYKAFEPIGCRDHHTVKLFQKIGVKSYYSGCLTLTFENKFTENERNDEILFVDAFNKNLPSKLREKYFNQLVPPSIRNKTKFIYHSHDNINMTDEERLTNAQNLIDRYSKAHLVVTSRIHCALPCLALGTPVLFLDVGFNTYNSRNRFDGTINYFNRLDNSSFRFSGIKPFALIARRTGLFNVLNTGKSIKFDWENPPSNPKEHLPIRKEIIDTVNQFFN